METTFVPLNPSTLSQLADVHSSLLRLHKALLDDERAAYERVHGPVGGAGRLLDLVMTDPWFDWLHRLSQLVVKIDELTESSESSLEDAHEIFESAAGLLLARDPDQEFTQRYKAVLKRNSAAVLAHVEALRAVHRDRQ